MDAFMAETFAPHEMAKWPNIAPLDELAEITAPQVDPKLPQYRHLPHIYGKTIEEGTGRLLAYKTAAEDGMTSGKYNFKAGSILYSKIRPYLRKATIVDFDGLCSADMYPLQLKTDDLIPEFLMWSLLSPAFTNYANNLSGRARIPKLNREQLFNYEMRYPAKEIQESINVLLQTAREEVVAMQETNERDTQYLDQLEQAILSQAFRGEL
jgi:type I restriction enzyme, S subunit